MKTKTAKIIRIGTSQGVLLPKEFHFQGDRVRIRRIENGGVLLEPIKIDVKAWLAELHKYKDVPFMPEGRQQPKTQKRKKVFD